MCHRVNKAKKCGGEQPEGRLEGLPGIRGRSVRKDLSEEVTSELRLDVNEPIMQRPTVRVF